MNFKENGRPEAECEVRRVPAIIIKKDSGEHLLLFPGTEFNYEVWQYATTTGIVYPEPRLISIYGHPENLYGIGELTTDENMEVWMSQVDSCP